MSRRERTIGFYCRSCKRSENSEGVPVGWYVLSRKARFGQVRLGLYCSAYCMGKAIVRIEERERERGADWESASPISGGTSAFDRKMAPRHSAESRESIERLMREARS